MFSDGSFLLFFSRQSHVIQACVRLLFLLFLRRRSPQNSLCFRPNNFYFFFSNRKRQRVSTISSFYFFNATKTSKFRLFKVRKQKIFRTEFGTKNDLRPSKPVFSHSHGTPKTGFRAPLPPKIFPATVCGTVESRCTPLSFCTFLIKSQVFALMLRKIATFRDIFLLF